MIKSPVLQKLCAHTDKFDINRRDSTGETALMLAAQEGLINNVKTLLDAGANPETPDNNGLTPLQAAEESGRQEVVDLIKNAIDKKYGKK
jgi:ankyrin repeat protein